MNHAEAVAEDVRNKEDAHSRAEKTRQEQKEKTEKEEEEMREQGLDPKKEKLLNMTASEADYQNSWKERKKEENFGWGRESAPHVISLVNQFHISIFSLSMRSVIQNTYSSIFLEIIHPFSHRYPLFIFNLILIFIFMFWFFPEFNVEKDYKVYHKRIKSAEKVFKDYEEKKNSTREEDFFPTAHNLNYGQQKQAEKEKVELLLDEMGKAWVFSILCRNFRESSALNNKFYYRIFYSCNMIC